MLTLVSIYIDVVLQQLPWKDVIQVIQIVIIELNQIEFVIGVCFLFDCFPARIFCIGFHTPKFDVNIPGFDVENTCRLITEADYGVL